MAFPDDRDLRLNRQAEHAWRLAVSLSDWAARHNPDRQRENLAPLSEAEEFELLQLRRRSEHLLSAAGVPVAAAVYGPSQSGKSLFLGHVLTPREPQYSPLGRDEALGEPAYYPGLSFTQDLNPQCGSMEATALVTRFTTKDRVPQDVLPPYPVMAYALTRADWLRVLGRGFQAECCWSSQNRWTPDNLEAVLIELAADSRTRGDRVDRQWRMDLSDCYDHMKRHDEQRFLSNGAEFGGLLTRYPLSEAGYTVMAARLLWDGWSTLNSLFSRVLEFLNVQVRRDRVTPHQRPGLLAHWAAVRFLLDSQRAPSYSNPSSRHFTSLDWSDFQLVQHDGWTVLDYLPGRGGALDLAILQAALLELVIPVLPERLHDDWRGVLGSIDLLDIPGMRAGREGDVQGKRTSASSLTEQMEIVKRGKVLYLFDRYVDELQIQTLLLLVRGGNLEVRGQMSGTVDRWGRVRYAREWGRVSDEPPAFLVGMTGIDDDFRNVLAHPGPNLYDNRFRQLSDTLGTVMRDFDGRGHPFQNVFPVRYPGTWDTDHERRQIQGPLKWEQARTAFLASEEVRKHVREPQRRWDAAMDDADGGMSLVSETLRRATTALGKQDQLEREIRHLLEHLVGLAQAWVVPAEVNFDRDQRAELGRKLLEWVTDPERYASRIFALNQSICLREGDAYSLADLEETPARTPGEPREKRLHRALNAFLEEWVGTVPRRWEEQSRQLEDSNSLAQQNIRQFARYLADYLHSPRVFESLYRKLMAVVFLEQHDETAKRHARRRYTRMVLNDFLMNPGPRVPVWAPETAMEHLEYGLQEPLVRRWLSHLPERLADGAGDDVRVPSGNQELKALLDEFAI